MLKVTQTDKGKIANGIICDITGDIYEDNFVYYSTDIDQIGISGKQKLNQGKQFDLDVGERCFEEMKKRCLSHIENRKNGFVNCDFCGAVLSGNFLYFMLKLLKVTVDKSLSVQRPDGSYTLEPTADTMPTDFELCHNCYKELTSVVMETRKKYGR